MSHRNYVQEDKKWTGDIDVLKQKMNYQTGDLGYKRFEDTLSDWRKYCEYWKSFPDKFVDFLKDEGTVFDLNFYQRILLRILFRYNKVFITAPRGSSKSFLEILALMLKCIMQPRVHYFICAPGKTQASQIAQERINEIWDNWKLLKREVKYKSFQKDYTKLVFHNNSQITIVQMKDSARGGRKTMRPLSVMIRKKLF